MNILHVIHGYPPYYMAGSEVYTYNLTQELSKRNRVHVFTRIENPFMDMYFIFDEDVGLVHVRRINKPRGDYNLSDKYLDERVDEAYKKYMKELSPDVVHIQHLSHLSTNIPIITKKEFGIPIVFTIHDFWMFCVRGQLLTPDYKICTGPSEDRCVSCLKYLHTTLEEYRRYKEHMNEVLANIDYFLAPSRFIRQFYIDMGIPEEKVVYSKYGFNKKIIRYRKKTYSPRDSIRFGFVGRVIPSKGVHLLLRSFSSIKDRRKATLRIYGNAGKYRTYLQNIASEGVEFMESFDNSNIDFILDDIDVLMVPSIWYENAPLVIQEAMLKGIPVITSDIGGMAELVKDGVNGLLFRVGDSDDLREKMEMIIKDPTIMNSMETDPESIRSIEDDANFVEDIYRRLIG